MMYIVHIDNNRIVTEEQLKKEYYENEKSDLKPFSEKTTFDEWLLCCIEEGYLSFAN